MKLVLLAVAVFLLAACGSTATVTKTAPPIRNGQTKMLVLAHFAGRPAAERDGGQGYTCRRYVQDTNPTHPTVGSWVILLCFKGLPS